MTHPFRTHPPSPDLLSCPDVAAFPWSNRGLLDLGHGLQLWHGLLPQRPADLGAFAVFISGLKPRRPIERIIRAEQAIGIRYILVPTQLDPALLFPRRDIIVPNQSSACLPEAI